MDLMTQIPLLMICPVNLKLPFFFQAIVKKSKKETLQDFFTYSLLLNYSVPLLFAVTVLIADGFGYATSQLYSVSPWCWIKSDHQIFRLLFYYFPAVVILVTNLLLYVPIIIKSKRDLNFMKNRVKKRVMLYILIYTVLIMPGLINRLLEFFFQEPVFFLFVIEAIATRFVLFFFE